METEGQRPKRHRGGESEHPTVVFNVGGRHFEVLRQTIEARPSTLLASLLEDIGTDRAAPIFVDANPERFACILDWYRFGEMHMPTACAVGGLLCDARYFLLPDSVRINGTWHTVAFDEDSREAAASSFFAAMSNVTDHWPTFEAYVSTLVQQVREDWKSVGKQAKLVCNDLSNCSVEALRDDGCLKSKIALSQLPASQEDIWRHGYRHVWLDQNNVCNRDRLRSLIAELARRGFECEVVGRAEGTSPLELQVGLSARENANTVIAAC